MIRILVRNLSLCLLLALPAAPALAAFPSFWGEEPMPSLAPMLKKTMPAVVNIATEGRVVQQSPLADPLLRRFFGVPPAQEKKVQGLGSGVIIDADKGYIVTNHHVIENAEHITVTLNDGRRLEAELVGDDPETDIAVIRVQAKDLHDLELADSDKLQVGDFVVAIGSPFGLRQTVTSGIVSGLGRSGLGIESYEDFIQTDASINPGNSGGALVDLKGRLVGINTAILGPNGGNIGIGFAIPANMVHDVVAQLIEHGKVRRGRLGVVAQDLTPELAGAFGIERDAGAVIAQVERPSPAERAGIRAGDVVTRVNGRQVRGASDMRNVIGLLRVGSEVELELLRNGRPMKVSVRIEAPEVHVLDGGELSHWLKGLKLADRDAEGKAVEGVLVQAADPRSPAVIAGLRPGDLILSANRQPVRGLDDLRKALHNGGRGLLLNVQRGASAFFVLLR
ncbi:MAG: DegQ family serine endoprotease [Gammaproteobacteria bacterium]|nr:MAG: DegQ family serine endoprotease [Gammaproteobacteria bacterium]